MAEKYIILIPQFNDWEALNLLIAKINTDVAGDIPVSYTHLDVYKRQMLAKWQAIRDPMMPEPSTATFLIVRFIFLVIV